jgi:deoxyribodipyrimidine photo-lyase
MVGADYSSKFSAWLAQGCMSPRSIYAEIKKYESKIIANESTYWLFFELLWREYFRWILLKYGNHFYQKKGIQKNKSQDTQHDILKFESWKNGTTGHKFIDANMRELNLTGFMSNRGRQNVASYLCHNLKLDWRYGAAYFEQELIDYDVACNWCNWAYVAGVGNDPRPNRVFNIDKQANDYDPTYKYRNIWTIN